MQPQSAKQKGRLVQQAVRDAVYRFFPSLEPGDVESTAMGQSGEDIKLSPAARKLFPYAVECKSHNNFSIYKHYQQAKSNSSKSLTPLLVIKANHQKPLVVVDLDHFTKEVQSASSKQTRKKR